MSFTFYVGYRHLKRSASALRHGVINYGKVLLIKRKHYLKSDFCLHTVAIFQYNRARDFWTTPDSNKTLYELKVKKLLDIRFLCRNGLDWVFEVASATFTLPRVTGPGRGGSFGNRPGTKSC